MPENLAELMHHEYQEKFPTWNWDHPHPDQFLDSSLNQGFARAQLLEPQPGNMEAMFALAFRCVNFEAISIPEVTAARILAWGQTAALNGQRIMDLEETFEEGQQQAVKNALNLKNKGGNERLKKMTDAEVATETRESFRLSHIGFLDYRCSEIDIAEKHLKRILTYLPYEDPRQDYFS